MSSGLSGVAGKPLFALGPDLRREPARAVLQVAGLLSETLARDPGVLERFVARDGPASRATARVEDVHQRGADPEASEKSRGPSSVRVCLEKAHFRSLRQNNICESALCRARFGPTANVEETGQRVCPAHSSRSFGRFASLSSPAGRFSRARSAAS